MLKPCSTQLKNPPHTHVETTVLSPPAHKEHQSHTSFSDVTPSNNGATDHVPLTNGKRAPSLSVSDLNPPDIQKVVVEHIRTEARRPTQPIIPSETLLLSPARLPHLIMKLIMTHGAHT